MSASAFLRVLGEAGDAKPPWVMSIAYGGPITSETELYIVASAEAPTTRLMKYVQLVGKTKYLP